MGSNGPSHYRQERDLDDEDHGDINQRGCVRGLF